jgi:hypothetical protein
MAQQIANTTQEIQTNFSRSQHFDACFAHAVQNLKKPLSAELQKWVKFYFDIMFFYYVDPSFTSITPAVEQKVRGLRDVIQLSPFTADERKKIEQYAADFGYSYVANANGNNQETSAPPSTVTSPPAPSSTVTITDNTQKTNYKTIATIVGIAITAIVAFFVFRKRKR